MQNREKDAARSSAPMLFFTPLILILGVASATAQTSAPSTGDFEERFLFDRGRGQPPSAPAPERGAAPPSSEQKAPGSVLKELIIPPAEAEPATPPASRDAASPASHEAVLPVPAQAPLTAAPVGQNSSHRRATRRPAGASPPAAPPGTSIQDALRAGKNTVRTG